MMLVDRYLSRNSLAGPIPLFLFNLVHLEQLYIRLGLISPPFFWKEMNFEIKKTKLNRDLIGNEFSGDIPALIGNLVNLKGLYIIFSLFFS